MMHRNRNLVSGLARMASVLLALAVVLASSTPAMAQKAKKKKIPLVMPVNRPNPAKDVPGKSRAPTVVRVQGALLAEVDPDAPQPTISVDDLVHDFGETWIGPKLQHTFKITNKGAKTLRILKVRPSCGCTIAGTYPRTLEPGETGEFPFSINSNKLRGKYEKSITVTSNDPASSSIKLKLRGHCKRYVSILPAAANFGRVYGSEEQQRVLKVTNNTDNPLELELDVPKDSKFGFELIEVEAGKKYEIHVSLTGGKKTGMIREIATLKTNVGAQKTIKVSATATIPKRLDVVPAVITLAKPRPGQSANDRPTTRIVRFANYGATPTKVLEATVDDPKVSVTVTERIAGKNYDVRLEFPPGYLPPSQGRTLTIKTDDKEQPVLTVTLRAPASRQAANKPRAKRPAEELVGQKAPTFSGTTTEGKPLDNTTLASAITVLDFFAVNCGYCGKQIPRVEKIRQEYEGKGVRFIVVSQTMRNKRYTDDQVKDKIKTLGFRGELVIDSDNKIGPLFKASSYPTMTILGKDGKVAAVNVGNVADLETRMKGQLDALIAGKPVPTFAKAAPKKSKKRPAEEMVGKPAPSFSLSTIDGKSIASAEFASHPATVLNFISPNCGYCKKQTPKIEKIRAEYEAKGVRFVNMSMKMGKGLNRATKEPWTPSEIVDLFKKAGSNLEIAIDEGNVIGRQFKASSFPTMAIVGKDGKIAAVNIGALADLEKRMRGQLDALIAGKPIPSFASAAPKSRQRPAEGMKGKAAPAFSLSTIGGKTISSAEFAKHAATVLNFISPNCGYCKRQVPNVEKVRAEYEAKGVRFVNMSMKMGKGLNRATKEPWTPSEIVETFKKAGSNLELAIDEGNAIGNKYKATSFPTMMIVGKDGKIAHVNIGAKKNLAELLKGQLDGLLGAKPATAKKVEAKTGKRLGADAATTLVVPKPVKTD